jgi:phage terminase large subunit GpA-like protein
MGGFERSAPVSGPTYVDITQGGRKLKRGARLWTVSVAVFKSETYRFLRLDRPTDEELAEDGSWPDGYIHLPKGMDSEWVKQLTAEQLVTIKNRQGFTRLEWQKLRERNEALDNRVYARAAAWVSAIDRWPDHKWRELEEQLGIGTGNDETGAGKPASRPRRRVIGSPYMTR